MSTLAFVDTETTGLDPDLHEIWEVGMILRAADGSEEERTWQLDVDLGRADVTGLKIGRFYERRTGWDDPEVIRCTPYQFAEAFEEWTRGAHLVGAVVSFDEERLRRLLRRNGACPGWHYHLVDVEALAAGKLGLAPPWKSDDLSAAVGVDPEQFDRHTALGDARWARAIFDACVARDAEMGASPE